jgi:hypothetical protein
MGVRWLSASLEYFLEAFTRTWSMRRFHSYVNNESVKEGCRQSLVGDNTLVLLMMMVVMMNSRVAYRSRLKFRGRDAEAINLPIQCFYFTSHNANNDRNLSANSAVPPKQDFSQSQL